MYVTCKTKTQVKSEHTFTFGCSIHVYNSCFSGNDSVLTSFLNKTLIQIHSLWTYCSFLKVTTVMQSSQVDYSSKSSKIKKNQNHQTNQPKKKNHHQVLKDMLWILTCTTHLFVEYILLWWHYLLVSKSLALTCCLQEEKKNRLWKSIKDSPAPRRAWAECKVKLKS